MSTEGQTRPQGAAGESPVPAKGHGNDVPAERKLFAERAVLLLREYATRLDQVRSEIDSILKQMSEIRQTDDCDGIRVAKIRLNNLLGWYDGIERSVKKLSRAVSQRLEHSELDDATRLELDVRLADFEGSLHGASMGVMSAREYARELR